MTDSSEENEDRSQLGTVRRVFAGILSLGNIFGALFSLVSFPSALVALYVYHAELLDLVTDPDLRVAPDFVSVRCFPQQPDFSDGYANDCQNGPVAISFGYSVQNLDRIDRRIEALQVTLELPGLKPLDLKFAYDRDHRLIDQTHRTDDQMWRFKTIPKEAALNFEVVLLPDRGTNFQKFATFVDAIRANHTALTEQPIPMTLEVRTGKDTWLEPVTCKLNFTPESAVIFLAKDPEVQVAITARCLS